MAGFEDSTKITNFFTNRMKLNNNPVTEYGEKGR